MHQEYPDCEKLEKFAILRGSFCTGIEIGVISISEIIRNVDTMERIQLTSIITFSLSRIKL